MKKLYVSPLRICAFFDQMRFDNPKNRNQHWGMSIFIILLFLLGLAFWVYFFNTGKLSLKAFDWIKESLYLDTLRNAQISGVIPWNWNEPFYFSSKKFLTNPEILLTPDIFLLPWISNGYFVIIHVILMYSVGFIGSVALAKKMKIGLISFLLFWLVFNFNGYIITHLAVGHFQWTGYFILPIYFIILFRMVSEARGTSDVNNMLFLIMGIILGFLFLNGSFHIAIWCSIFMVIAFIWDIKSLVKILIAIMVGSLLSLGRLLPAALFFHFENPQISKGYSTWGNLFNAITSYQYNPAWEYDIFIGLFSFIALVIGFYFALDRKRIIRQMPLLIAAALFLLISLFNIYDTIIHLNLPFVKIERAPSRFIVMPFLVFIIISVKGIDDIISKLPKISKLVMIVVIPFIINDLFIHSTYWRIEKLERSFKVISKPIRSIVSNPDQMYSLIIYASWTISIITFIVIGIILFRYLTKKSLKPNENELLF